MFPWSCYWFTYIVDNKHCSMCYFYFHWMPVQFSFFHFNHGKKTVYVSYKIYIHSENNSLEYFHFPEVVVFCTGIVSFDTLSFTKQMKSSYSHYQFWKSICFQSCNLNTSDISHGGIGFLFFIVWNVNVFQ